jgi:hypothetical protein
MNKTLTTLAASCGLMLAAFTGVAAHAAEPVTTASGLVYERLKEGTGARLRQPWRGRRDSAQRHAELRGGTAGHQVIAGPLAGPEPA